MTKLKDIFLITALSLGMLTVLSSSAVAWVLTGSEVNADIKNDNKYADGLLTDFAAVPIVDVKSARLFDSETKTVYPLTDRDKFSDIEGKLSDSAFLQGYYTFTEDSAEVGKTGKTVEVGTEHKGKYHHPYSRLEEIRQVTLSYKPEPELLNKMRFDGEDKNAGTSLYPGNKDETRSFDIDNSEKQNSENTVQNPNGGVAVHPGIKQILFYNRNGYQYLNPLDASLAGGSGDSAEIVKETLPNLQAMPIGVINLEMMDGLTEQREKETDGYPLDDREPLKMAAWFEHKLLMPLKNIKVVVNDKEKLLSGSEEMSKAILAKRRKSFLQESVLDALRVSAYVQIKSARLIDAFGMPEAENGIDRTEEEKKKDLMYSLIGKDVTFTKTDAGSPSGYSFSGPFLYAVSPKENTSVDADLNSSLRANFVARDLFMQMLASYQQILAARLRLRVASSMVADSPRLEEDKEGVGAMQALYEAELEKRKEAANQ